jgi:uncharacterized repeat protein (TIGR01451 family)
MNKFFSPATKGPKNVVSKAFFGLLIAGAVLMGGNMLTGGSLIPAAHAWFCTTNSKSSPCATVTTIVNVNGGSATPSNFSVSLWGSHDPATTTFAGSASGTVENIVPEQYQVSVASKKNYTPSYSNCSGNLSAGDSQTCTVTETYSAPTPTPSADIAISKTADVSSTYVGGTVNYTVTVTDNGPATSTGVVATDALPSGLTFVSATTSAGSYASSTGTWNVGTLSNGQSATLVITATVQNSLANTDVTNTATVSESAGIVDPNTGNNTASVCICVYPAPAIPSADISVVKTADVTSTNEGDTVHYTVIVAALGPATSTGVVATDLLPSGLTLESATASVGSYATSTGMWTIGDMGASSTATLQIAALVNSGTANTDITNTATVGESSSSTDSNLSNNSSSVSICVEPNGTSTPVADISIVKTVDNANPAAGATVNYTLTVTDNGPATSTGVVATDTLPSGLTFVSATTSAGSYASSTGTWTIGTLNANATATLQIAATVNSGTAGQTITNIGTVGESSSTTDNNLMNNSSSVAIVVQGGGCTSNCGGGGGTDADIAITKTANVSSTTEGGTIDYTITAIANGPAASTDVVATDTLPSGLTFVSATTSAGSYASSTGTWTIGTLNASTTATLTIEATVNAGTAGTTITNQATIGESTTETDNVPGNNTAQVSVPVVSGGGSSNDADLAVVKTVDNASPLTGSDVNFTVVVTNNGPATAEDIVANDQLPVGLATIGVTSTPSTTFNMGTGVWDIGTLAPNATATLTVEAEVSAPAGTTIVNTATVASTLSSLIDPNLANNSSSVTLNVQAPGGGGCTSNCGGGGGSTPTAEIGIVKTVDNSTPATGATINYTLTVSATGPSTSLGVVADDVLPAGVVFDSASSSEGSYASSTGVWTIGTLNAGQNATLVITATVTAPNGTVITNTGTVSESPTVIDQLSGNNTSSVTITVGGNGGGGGGGGGGGTVGVPSGGGGNGGGGGQVLGTSTSTGQVLGASCGLYLTSYIHPVRKYLNDPAQVEKLQVFLNMNLGLNLPVDGNYSNADIAAVNQFQVKYHTEVLAPWVPLGLPTQFTPTSYVYQSTQRWINLIMCPPLNLPLPALKVDTGE